jgi:hypothetical protein
MHTRATPEKQQAEIERLQQAYMEARADEDEAASRAASIADDLVELGAEPGEQ